MKTAFYAGSFDPFTYGHSYIIEEALRRYDKVYVGVGCHKDKKYLLTQGERALLIMENFPQEIDAGKLVVETYDGLTVDKAISVGADILIRGVRSAADTIKEEALSEINRTLAKVRGKKLDTVFIKAKGDYKNISSSMVKNLCEIQEFISALRFVPANVHNAMMEKYLKDIYFSILNHTRGKNLVYLSDKEFSAELSWEYIVSEYCSRPYHNLSHLGYMLNILKIDNIRYDKNLIMAIFWHDVVHHCNSNDEYKSVEAMQPYLPIIHENGMCGATIKEYIMATSETRTLCSQCERIFADIDKVILAAPFSHIWSWYENGVKEECMLAKQCTEKEYEEGRKSFLSKLLEKPRIFHTELFYNKYEKKARQNIDKQIKKFI